MGVSVTPSIPGEIGINGEDFNKIDSEKGSLSTTDWWPMFRHDLNHSGYSTAHSPDTNIVTWTYNTENWVYSSPAVSNGKVYIGSDDGKVYCLDANDGIEKWNFTTGDWVDSSPAVSDGKVYFGSLDHKVYCLNADDGTKIWNYTTGGCVFSSPAVSDGKVYIGSDDGIIYCLDADDGTRIWYMRTGDWVWSSPAVYDGKVFFGSGDFKVYCMNAGDGAIIWDYDTGNWVDSSPAVSDGKVYIGSFDNKVYCLDTSNGNEIWNYTTGDGVRSSPAVSDGKVYIGSLDNIVYCFGDKVINKPPYAPKIDGPTSGNAGKEYNYIFNSTDPNGDDVYYFVKWGDGHFEVWDGPYSSGDDVIISHTFARQGTFTIEAKAKDIHGNESGWTEFYIKIPRNKPFIFNLNLLNWLFEQFPKAFPILRYILIL